MVHPRIIPKKTLLLICFVLCPSLSCISTSGLIVDEEVYTFPYTDYWLGYHDYWYRLYHDDFWYYDYDPSEDNNCQPLKQEWNQVKKRVKDYRKIRREEKEERRKKIWQKWREIRRERWAQVDSISRRPRPKEIFRFHPRTSQKRKK